MVFIVSEVKATVSRPVRIGIYMSGVNESFFFSLANGYSITFRFPSPSFSDSN